MEQQYKLNEIIFISIQLKLAEIHLQTYCNVKYTKY